MNFLKREKVNSVVLSCVFIVLGLLFCIVPNKSLSIIETIASVCLIAFGVVSLFLYCFTPILFRDSSSLVNAILAICLGLLISFIPSFFVFGVGLVVAFNGLERFGYSLDLKEVGDKKWWIDCVSGIIIFALGITTVILCNTSVASSILMIYFGISIILDGVINLTLIFALHREITKVKKFVKSNGEGFTDYEVK
jgi:hypothetical protein